MRKIKEVIRLKFESQLSEHEIAYSCQISRTTVRDYLRRATLAQLNWAEAAALGEVQLIERLFPVLPPPIRLPQQINMSKALIIEYILFVV